MKRLALLPLLLASTALAQTRQPAEMTTVPSSNPQGYDLKDSTGKWVKFGEANSSTHTWKGVGAAFEVDQFGAKGDFVADDGPAIVAALNAAPPGATVMLAAHPYWNQTQNIVVPKNVRLTCAGGFTKFSEVYDHTAMPCTIYQKAGTSLTYYGELRDIGVLNDIVHFMPKATRANIEAFIAAFAGTGVAAGPADATENGSQAILQNVAIGGFQTCVNVNGAYQQQIRQVLGDCTNGFALANSHDNNFFQDIEFWPFLTTHRPGTGNKVWNISAIADNGAGLWRITTSAANDIVTGEQLWIAPNVAGGAGSGGQWTVTAIDATHFDLQGSASAPAATGDTLINQTYIGNLSSVANLQPGMTVTGAGVPVGATIAAVWRTRNAISLDQKHPATATATVVSLAFASTAYSGGAGRVFYDGTWRSGIGFNLGAADGTKCVHCFAFGHVTGFSFTDSVGVAFTGADSDQLGIPGGPTPHLCNQNVVPVGIKVAGVSFDSQVSGSVLTNDCVSVMNVGTNVNPGFTVRGFRPGSFSTIATKLENAGPLQLTMTGMQDAKAASILLDNSAQSPILSDNYLPNTSVFSTGLIPTFYGSGNVFIPSGPTVAAEQQVAFSHRAQSLWAMGYGGAPLFFYDASQPLDTKYWRFNYTGGTLCLASTDDLQAAGQNALCFQRSANSLTGITLGALTSGKSYTVAALPACAAGTQGDFAYVLDSAAITASSYMQPVVGGGAVKVSVFCDGTGWKYH